MNFIQHSELRDQHAMFGASQYHWLNYDSNKLKEYYFKMMAKQRGTELHAFAAQCIKLGQKLPKSKRTLNMYVNDAIGFNMTPEQPLCYSANCFGTADAISFFKNVLRIHDFKSGVIPAHMEQLMIYASLFCLEYNIKPTSISNIELRIYQNDEILQHNPTSEEITTICDKIVLADKIITQIKMEGV